MAQSKVLYLLSLCLVWWLQLLQGMEGLWQFGSGQLELVPALPRLRTWSFHPQAWLVPFGSWHDRDKPTNAPHICTQGT